MVDAGINRLLQRPNVPASPYGNDNNFLDAQQFRLQQNFQYRCQQMNAYYQAQPRHPQHHGMQPFQGYQFFQGQPNRAQMMPPQPFPLISSILQNSTSYPQYRFPPSYQ